MRKKHRILRNLLLDMLAAGLALTVFALFHHVLPREQQSLNVQTVNTAAAEETTEITGSGDSGGHEAGRNVQAAQSGDVTEAGGAEEPAGENRAGEEAEDARTGATSKVDSFRPSDRATASAGTNDTKGKGGSSGQSKRKNNNGSSGGNGKNAMTSKGGSALTEADTGSSETTETAESVPLSEKFADQFTDTVAVTENSYSSPDLSITVSEVNEGSLTYYLADIYVRDITCFRTALAEDSYGSGFRDSIEEMAELNNALLAVNGDYYGNTSEGVVIRNGVIYRANTTNCDVCVLYYDGTMKVMPGSSFSMEEAVADGAWQAWTFGPALLDTNGETITAFSSSNRIISANPRTAIGYYEPGHYCLVVVDGRGESSGITLPRLSQLFHDLGCTAAYNLDGGNSSIMVWGDEVINNPSGGGRESSDALLIAEVRDYE